MIVEKAALSNDKVAFFYAKLEMEVSSKDKVQDEYCYTSPKDSGSPFIEGRYIALWRMFDDLNNTIGFEDSIMHYLRAPSVTVFRARQIYRIASLPFADEDTIAEENGIVGMDSCTSHTSSTSNGGRAKAFA